MRINSKPEDAVLLETLRKLQYSKNMEDKDFFLKPNTFEERIGNITTEISLKVIPGLEKTCNAMTELAKAELRDDLMFKQDQDDYTPISY